MQKKFVINKWALLVLVSGGFQISKAALCCFPSSKSDDSAGEESRSLFEEQTSIKRSKIGVEETDTTHKEKKASWHDDCDECEKIRQSKKIRQRQERNIKINVALDEVIGLIIEKTLHKSIKKVVEQDSDSLVHCAICMLVSSHKRVLHAAANGVQHVFCKRCLQGCLDKNVTIDFPWRYPITLPCPLCRTPVSAETVTKLCRGHSVTNS